MFNKYIKIKCERDTLKDELRKSRREAIGFGHSWDIADVMAVLDRLGK